MFLFTRFIIISYIEYVMKECENKKKSPPPPQLISFIVLNKNQYAHEKETPIMIHGMKNK